MTLDSSAVRLQIALLATAWCALHSLLIAPPIERRLRRALGGRAAWYRLGYNLVSGATLLAVWWFFRSHPGHTLWRWHGPWRLLQTAGWLAVLLVGWLGVRAHHSGTFLGLRQIRDARSGRPAAEERLSRRGILGVIRHPWYAAGLLLLIVVGDITTTDLIWRGIFFVYLLVGSKLEERKLLARFGKQYADYMREVPALLPRWRD